MRIFLYEEEIFVTMHKSRYQRIMIFGRPGSGKSTFALMLHQRLGLPLHHLDKHFFTANWEERNYDEFIAIQKAILAEDAWIIDGNSTKSLSLRYQRADLVIFMNYPRMVCYFRVFHRLFYKNPLIDDRAANCPETVRMNLLRYMWSYDARVRPIINELTTAYPTILFLQVSNQRSLRAACARI